MTETSPRTVERSQHRDPAKSYCRITVVERTRRTVGEIVEPADLPTGAEIVVSPEQGPLTGSKVVAIARRIERALAAGLSHAIVVIAEDVELPLTVPRSMSPGQVLTAALRAYFQRPCTPVQCTEVRFRVIGRPPRGEPWPIRGRLIASRYDDTAARTTPPADAPEVRR